MSGSKIKKTLYTWQLENADCVEEPAVAYEVTLEDSGHPAEFPALWSASMDVLDQVEELKQGLSAELVDELCIELQITRQELARYTGVGERTLKRKLKEGRLSCGQSERIVRLSRLLERAVQVMGSREAAVQWLKAPRLHLRGQTPLEMGVTELGTEEVLNLLGRIEHGVFT
jgi:putative toxin-antitoxin system antitoxin component (TIGR02293 family)